MSTSEPAARTPDRRPRRRPGRRAAFAAAALLAVVLVAVVAGYGLWASSDGGGFPARQATGEEVAELRQDGPPATLADFEGMESLRAVFNGDRGRPRIVLLLSTTCITCLKGASWVQQELAEHPDADVAVYAVWLPMLPSDDRAEWDGRILNDPRVTHLWDEEQASGRWFAQQGYGRGTSRGSPIQLPVQWDAFFVYGGDSSWPAGGKPSHLAGWGRPILAETRAFEEATAPLLRR